MVMVLLKRREGERLGWDEDLKWGEGMYHKNRNGPQDKRGHAVTKKESKVRGGV